MKSDRLVLIAALSPALVLAAAAQTPVPAPPPPGTIAPLAPPALMTLTGTPATHTSRVNAVVYGPQGEVQALTLRDGVAVSLPPDLGMRLQATVTRGARVQVSGNQQVIAGQTSLVAQSVTANGQTFVATQPVPGLVGVVPSAPPPPIDPDAPRGPRNRRGPGAPPPPPVDAGGPPPSPDGVAPPPPPPDGAAPPPPSPTGAPAPPPPQME